MTDTEFEAQKQRVMALSRYWRPLLVLEDWDIRYDFYDYHERKEPNTLMMVDGDWRYMHAVVSVFVPQVAKEDDKALELAFVHEMMHIVLGEMEEGEKHHEERVATVLAKAFLRVRDSLTPEQQAA